MLTKEIANDKLQLSDIPAADAPFDDISDFGYTYNGYEQIGSPEACVEIANAHRHDTLTELRTCLFFEQRRWHHFGDLPEAEDEQYQRGLVEQIRIKVAANDLR